MRSEEKEKKGAHAFPQNFLIWAGDSRFLEDEAKNWVMRWGGADGAVNLSAEGLDPGELAMELNTLPMWSERQVVRLRQAESASDGLLKALERYLEDPAPSAALLVEYVGNLEDKKLPAAWKRLLDKVQVKSCAPRGSREYISKRLRAEGFTISPDASTALDDWACGDLGRLVSALDLLCLYRLDEKRISVEDLDALLGTGGTPREWDLQDAFLKGDTRTFLDLLGKIAQDPESAPLMFVGMVSKQLRSLMLMHGHEARGVLRKNISPKELGFNHPFPAQKLMGVAGKWPEPRVRQALGTLFELDLAIKSTAATKSNPEVLWALVERQLLKLMGK